jgi:hypothetical protein
MEETRSEFLKTITKQFVSWCKSKELEPTNEMFCEYLINRNLIIDRTINRFLVVDKYPEALAKSLGIKKFAIWQIEEEIGVKESTIKVILNRFQSFFRLESRVTSKS